jgi:cytoskeletal protein CcmA (bactofilin family)
MFNSKKAQPPIRTLIGEGSVLQGEIRFADGIRIDGEVHGDVVADDAKPSVVVISERAKVIGRVHAAHVIVNGEVQGPIESHQLLELQPKARVVGDIRYEALEMHQGAQIDGELRPLKAAERPPLVLAASNDTRSATPDSAPPQAKSA